MVSIAVSKMGMTELIFVVIGLDLWPNSTDLNLVDYEVWDVMQQRVYECRMSIVSMSWSSARNKCSKCCPSSCTHTLIFCNLHLEPKLWRHKWRNFRFCKSCRTAMRFSPLDSSEDFMGRSRLRFSLSLIVSELWRHQWRHNERCGLHPRPWTT